MSELRKVRRTDSDIAAATRITPSTWSLIIALIAVLSGWGWTTLANSVTNEKQDAAIIQKLDKEDANRQYDQIMKRLDDLHADIREVRDNQREEILQHKGSANE